MIESPEAPLLGLNPSFEPGAAVPSCQRHIRLGSPRVHRPVLMRRSHNRIRAPEVCRRTTIAFSVKIRIDAANHNVFIRQVTVKPFERRVWVWTLAAFLGLAGANRASAATVATGWRVGDHGAVTRFVLELGGPVPFKLMPESNPDRLRIDLPDT